MRIRRIHKYYTWLTRNNITNLFYINRFFYLNIRIVLRVKETCISIVQYHFNY